MGKLGGLSRPLIGLLSFLQLGAAATVIGITGIHLAGITSFSDLRTLIPDGGKMCLLSDDGAKTMCIYAYALGAVSIVFTLAIGLMQILTCGCCRCGAIMDSVFAIMATGWWVVGGFVVATHVAAADAKGLPQKQWRAAVAWLTWITAGLFGAMLLVHLARVAHKLCNCCGKRRRAGLGGGGGGKAMLGGADKPRSAALELGKEVRGRAYMAGGGGGGGGSGAAGSLQQQFRGSVGNI